MHARMHATQGVILTEAQCRMPHASGAQKYDGTARTQFLPEQGALKLCVSKAIPMPSEAAGSQRQYRERCCDRNVTYPRVYMMWICALRSYV